VPVGVKVGPALCGEPEQACCPESRFACALGSSCDADAGMCRALPSETPDAPILCHADADCASTAHCCNAGSYGTCREIEAGATCALPGLAVLASGAGVTVVEDGFDGVTPSEGGCVRSAGAHRRIVVPVAVANFGAADFILGQRDTRLSASDSARDDFLRYTLLDASGEPVASSHGQFPCTGATDTARRFNCDFAGLETGALAPALGLECERLDVTGLPAGAYRLHVELTRQWLDADPGNERVDIPLDLPSFNPLDPCPALANPLLGESGAYGECGWSQAQLPGPGTCTPGEYVNFDCRGCVGHPQLRACAGDTPCSARSAIGNGFLSTTSIGAIADPCISLQLACPKIGRYNVLLNTELPSEEASCTLTHGTLL
jgi:hypothetical protein